MMPFTEAGSVSGLKIAGEVSRVFNRVAIRYELFGHLTEVMIPMPADMPVRKNGLWEETCFELFVAEKDSSRYREFNLSPAGHWNVFRFESYRKGMQEDTAIGSLPFGVQRHPSVLSLSLEMDTNRINRPSQVMEVGLSAVIKYKNGNTSYWALTHLGQQADFHRRDSFIIEL